MAWTVLGAVVGLGTAVAADEEGLPVFTLDQVAEHDSLSSCWMAIEGRVYDLTSHIPMHPTEPDVLAHWCGQDATEAMRTKGLEPAQEHSATAWDWLEVYRIGTLGET